MALMRVRRVILSHADDASRFDEGFAGACV